VARGIATRGHVSPPVEPWIAFSSTARCRTQMDSMYWNPCDSRVERCHAPWSCSSVNDRYRDRSDERPRA
jgi:hypothetical protein